MSEERRWSWVPAFLCVVLLFSFPLLLLWGFSRANDPKLRARHKIEEMRARQVWDSTYFAELRRLRNEQR